MEDRGARANGAGDPKPGRLSCILTILWRLVCSSSKVIGHVALDRHMARVLPFLPGDEDGALIVEIVQW